MLKAVHYQINEIHQDQRPSYSTTLIHQSVATRSDRRPSRFTDQRRDNRKFLQGGAKGNHIEHHRQPDQEVNQDVRVHLNNL